MLAAAFGLDMRRTLVRKRTPCLGSATGPRVRNHERNQMRKAYRIYLLPVLAIAMLAIVPLQAQVIHTGRLKINNARYGKSGQGVDVTNRVRSMMQNNTLDFKVNNNNLGVDPYKGADKTLKLSYTYMGQQHNIVVKEGDRCRVP